MPDLSIGMKPQDASERERFEREVKRIVSAADREGLMVRLLGSLAFQTHCPNFGYLQAEMGRAYTDIDFAGYGRQAADVRRMLADLGYVEDREVFVVSEGGRAIFENPSSKLHVDVFYEKLDFCHVIPWNGRLEVDSPTIPLAELMLEKMQIVRINEKDVIDAIMLLLEHDLGDSDKEMINISRIAELCSQDWGLWRTVTMNLDKVRQLSQAYTQLSDENKATVATRLEGIAGRIKAKPKSLAWRLRARVGDRVKWYKDVDEVQ
jgi:hypothetical protein